MRPPGIIRYNFHSLSAFYLFQKCFPTSGNIQKSMLIVYFELKMMRVTRKPPCGRETLLSNDTSTFFSNFIFLIVYDMFPTHLVLKLAAIDPALGRLDYESLSDQTLMEMLFDGLNTKDKRRLQDGNGNYADTCEWTLGWRMEVQCTDDRMKVIDIAHSSINAKQFPFNFIPPLTEFFAVKDCGIQGTLDTSLLPVHLIKLNVTFNKLHGAIDVKAFPQTLRLIYIYVNAFSGSCALSELPSSPVELFWSRNSFSGELPLDGLPKNVKSLTLEKNNLTGSIATARLPSKLERLNLANNAFSGEFRLIELPKHLKEIVICGNTIERAVIAESSGKMFFSLRHDSLREVVDETGRRHTWAKKIISESRPYPFSHL